MFPVVSWPFSGVEIVGGCWALSDSLLHELLHDSRSVAGAINGWIGAQWQGGVECVLSLETPAVTTGDEFYRLSDSGGVGHCRDHISESLDPRTANLAAQDLSCRSQLPAVITLCFLAEYWKFSDELTFRLR